MIGESTTTKARLLHYFPPEETSGEKDLDSWCGTHLDHGCLTGLTSALWTDESELPEDATIGDVKELTSPPDPEAGLYIMDRNGALNKVRIPKEALAFQTGEALQCITNNKLKAVPHLVRGPQSNLAKGKVSRNTIAVFTRKLWIWMTPNFANETMQSRILERRWMERRISQHSLKKSLKEIRWGKASYKKAWNKVHSQRNPIEILCHAIEH